MTDDDRELARNLFGTLLEDEPPLRLRTVDLPVAGRRRRTRWAAGGAMLATAAGVTAVVLLATGAAPGFRSADQVGGKPAGPPPLAAPAPRTPVGTALPPVAPVPPKDLEQRPGATDILPPAQEQALMVANNEVFRKAYVAPDGWTITKRQSFIDDPGISDQEWNGGAVIGDAAGRRVTVLVGVGKRTSAEGRMSCLTSPEAYTLPGGEVVRVQRFDDVHSVTVCHDRGGDEVVWAQQSFGELFATEVTGPPVLPETDAYLAALATDPRFHWPAG